MIQGGEPGNVGQVLQGAVEEGGNAIWEDDAILGEEITATCVTGTKYTTSLINVSPTCGECAFIMVKNRVTNSCFTCTELG